MTADQWGELQPLTSTGHEELYRSSKDLMDSRTSQYQDNIVFHNNGYDLPEAAPSNHLLFTKILNLKAPAQLLQHNGYLHRGLQDCQYYVIF